MEILGLRESCWKPLKYTFHFIGFIFSSAGGLTQGLLNTRLVP